MRKKIHVLFLTLLLPIVMVAQTSTDVNGATWTYTTTGTAGAGGTCTVTNIAIGPATTGTTGTVSIPAYLPIGTDSSNGYAVTTIAGGINPTYAVAGSNIFGTVGLNGITPNTSLNVLDFSSATNLTTINQYAFQYCTGLTSAINFLPPSVTTLGAGAFQNDSNLSTELNLGSNLTDLSAQVIFYNCNHLLGDPNTILAHVSGHLGSQVFDLCSKLGLKADGLTPYNDGLDLSKTGITALNGQCFMLCPSITGDLNLGNVTTLNTVQNFYNCIGLTGDLNIILKNVTGTIGSGQFDGCTHIGLKSLPTAPYYGVPYNDGLDLSKLNITGLQAGVFHSMPGIYGDLNLGGVTDISAGSIFGFDTNLTGNLTTILKNVTGTIGTMDFYKCPGFTSTWDGINGSNPGLTVPTGVTVIDDAAFGFATGLTGALDLNNVQTIGNIDNNITQAIYTGAFNSTNFSIITNASKVTKIGNETFQNCSKLTGDLVLPVVTSIGRQAFIGDPIRSIALKSPSLSMIGSQVFSNCRNLEYIDLSPVSTFGGTITTLDRTVPPATGVVNSYPGLGYPFYNLPSHTLVYLPTSSASLQTTAGDVNYIFGGTGGTCTTLSITDGTDYYIPHQFTATDAYYYRSFPGKTGTETYAVSSLYLPFDANIPKIYPIFNFIGHRLHSSATDHTFVFQQMPFALPGGNYTAVKANTPYLLQNNSATSSTSPLSFVNAYVNVPQTPIGHAYIYDSTGTLQLNNPQTPPTPPATSNPLDANGLYTGGTRANPNTNTSHTWGNTADIWDLYGTTEQVHSTEATTWQAYALGTGDNLWHPVTGNIPSFRCFIAATPGAEAAAATNPFSFVLQDTAGNDITGIDNITIDGNQTGNSPANSVETRIYNVNGEYMGKDINTLPKGLYIVNGKKIVK